MVYINSDGQGYSIIGRGICKVVDRKRLVSFGSCIKVDTSYVMVVITCGLHSEHPWLYTEALRPRSLYC
jgi:hypothetical protein